jgi:hypothetical protein
MGVVRLRRRYNPQTHEMEDIPLTVKQRVRAHFVWDDLPGYVSPVTGLHVEGRRQRRNDLAATGCRPYEGREQESKEAAKAQVEKERSLDQLADRMAHQAWAQAPERVRKMFRSK